MEEQSEIIDSIYDKLDSGRYWCIKCQRGVEADEKGYCVVCKPKRRTTLLYKPVVDTKKVEEKVDKTPIHEIEKTTLQELEVAVMDKPVVKKKKKTKKVK